MRFRPPILASPLVVLVAAGATLAAATDWTPVTFRGKHPTEYTQERRADGSALRADSRQSASGLVLELSDEVDATALAWKWRLERCLDNPDEQDRAGDDFAARVFVLFGRERSRTPWGWLGRQLFASPFGSVRPRRALSFVWASRIERGQAMFSPVSDDVYQIAARSGCRHDSVWVAERYELDPLFARGFQEPLPRVVAVALMTDTDETAGHAVAWYDNVVLHLRTGETRSLPFQSSSNE